MKYLKVLGNNRTPLIGTGTWPKIGEWTPPIKGRLIACSRGYHLCTLKTLVETLEDILAIGTGFSIYEVVPKGTPVVCNPRWTGTKILCRQAKLTRLLVRMPKVIYTRKHGFDRRRAMENARLKRAYALVKNKL